MSSQAPLVLLVEDKLDTLQSRQRLFENADYIVIPATTAEDAILQVWSSPLISLVYTDIDLDPSEDRRDTSGVDLMKYLKSIRPELPIVGYSGQFEPGQIAPSDLLGFDRYHPRGTFTIDQMEEELEELRGLALTYTSARAREAEEELTKLRERHGIDPDVFRGFRALLPNKRYELEQALASSGYEALVAYPYSPLDASGVNETIAADSIGARLKVPIVFWVRQEDSEFEAEVLGVPQLYSTGHSQAEAIGRVMQLMVLFLLDTRGASDLDGPADELRVFLSSVLELVP